MNLTNVVRDGACVEFNRYCANGVRYLSGEEAESAPHTAYTSVPNGGGADCP